MSIRTYSELILIPKFSERFEYLKLNGSVGSDTFGFDRYLNQMFYRSIAWRKIRAEIVHRDAGCDLAMPDHDIFDRVYIHHMNPITVRDVLEQTDILLNPEYLITTSRNTHQAIHYGDESLLPTPLTERTMNDTCPWKK